jgi:hypothetical protein
MFRGKNWRAISHRISRIDKQMVKLQAKSWLDQSTSQFLVTHGSYMPKKHLDHLRGDARSLLI